MTTNLFEVASFEKQKAKKLQFKSYRMVSLIKYVKGRGLTQVEAVEQLGVDKSRMSNLMNHRIHLSGWCGQAVKPRHDGAGEGHLCNASLVSI